MLEALIIGAGPTGLTLACELARRGIELRIIDSAASPTQLSKALGVHARTLEIFDDLGIADALIAHGRKVVGISMYADGHPIVEVGFDELETRHPYILCAPQAQTERVLGDRLAALGRSVERSTTLRTFRAGEDRVTCTLVREDGGEETVETRYLLGCDGAHSAVRHGLGLAFEGSAYEDEFALADVKVEWALSGERVQTFFSPDGVLACFPMPDETDGGTRWRLLLSVAPDELDPDHNVQPGLDSFQRAAPARTGLPVVLRDPKWLARFRIHRRQVSRYRVGRVFLAGDAAHIHSPVGGQGMNFGIQDAHNLAWKLAMVLRGQGQPSLLDSYQVERHTLGQSLLTATDVATRAATLRNPVARAVRNHLATVLSQLEVIQQRITRRVSEISLDYARSPIVGETRGSVLTAMFGDEGSRAARRAFELAPHAGARTPDGRVQLATGETKLLSRLLDARQHTLLVFCGHEAGTDALERASQAAQRARERCGPALSVHVIAAAARRPEALGWDGSVLLDPEGHLEHAFGAVGECLYVLRPDLYVGYRSQPIEVDKLVVWLDRVFSARGPVASTQASG